MKPDPEIFENALSLLDLSPARTISIDDMSENHEAGDVHGFHSIHYQKDNHAGFVDQFEAARKAILIFPGTGLG